MTGWGRRRVPPQPVGHPGRQTTHARERSGLHDRRGPEERRVGVDTFLALVVSGAISGAIYSLVGSGLTLSYSATGIFNFSYGAVAFSSAYLFYIFHSGLHWPIVWAAVMVIGVFAPLLGIVLNAAVFRPLARANESAKIMATVGLLLAIPALTEWITDGIIDIFHVDIPNSSAVLQVGFPPGLGPVPQKTWHIPRQDPHHLERAGRGDRRCGLRRRALVPDAPHVVGPPDAGGGGPAQPGPDPRGRRRQDLPVRLGDRQRPGRPGRRGRRPHHRGHQHQRLHHDHDRRLRRRRHRRAPVDPIDLHRWPGPGHLPEPGGRLRQGGHRRVRRFGTHRRTDHRPVDPGPGPQPPRGIGG